MLASISPVGEASRRQRWPVTATAYLVASAVGGATTGLVAGLVGRGIAATFGAPPITATVAVLAGLAGGAVLVDRGVLPVPLPSWHRQVDETWLDRFRGWVYGAGFGFQLGAGVVTRVPTAASHLTALTAVAASAVTASVVPAIVVGTTYGAVRGLPLLLGAPLTTPAALNRFHARMEAATRRADVATSAAVGLSAIVLTVAVVAIDRGG